MEETEIERDAFALSEESKSGNETDDQCLGNQWFEKKLEKRSDLSDIFKIMIRSLGCIVNTI